MKVFRPRFATKTLRAAVTFGQRYVIQNKYFDTILYKIIQCKKELIYFFLHTG